MRRRPRAKATVERVGALVPTVLLDLGLGESVRALHIHEHWEEAVGAEVAAHSRPGILRDGALEVLVESSTWCQLLRLRTPELLDGLARALGDEAPRSLFLRITS